MKSMQNSFNSGSIQHEILFENSVTFYDDTMFCFETIPSHEKKTRNMLPTFDTFL